MTDRPILFSAPMVRALLAGQKTQTRRLLKPKKDVMSCLLSNGWTDDYILDPGNREWLERYYPWRIGDSLYVREAWSPAHITTGMKPRDLMPGSPIWHWADGRIPDGGDWTKPKPGIHMPRWASRITLTVTDVRVQRLQAMSNEDAEAEGFKGGQLDDGFGPRDIGGGFTVESPGTYASAAGMFFLTWQKLHPEWDGYDDPWVVAVSFRVGRHNIDQPALLTNDSEAVASSGMTLPA